MKKRLALSIICISLGLPAGLSAQAIAPGCYHRVYTQDHLAAHPNQGVAEIWLQVAPGGQFALAARMSHAGQAWRDGVGGLYLEEYGFCHSTRCQVDCDGGGFAPVRQSADSITIETDFTRLASGTCGSPGAAYSDLDEPPAGPTRYRLNRVAPVVCQGL